MGGLGLSDGFGSVAEQVFGRAETPVVLFRAGSTVR